jgi:hypothetical protein
MTEKVSYCKMMAKIRILKYSTCTFTNAINLYINTAKQTKKYLFLYKLLVILNTLYLKKSILTNSKENLPLLSKKSLILFTLRLLMEILIKLISI